MRAPSPWKTAGFKKLLFKKDKGTRQPLRLIYSKRITWKRPLAARKRTITAGRGFETEKRPGHDMRSELSDVLWLLLSLPANLAWVCLKSFTSYQRPRAYTVKMDQGPKKHGEPCIDRLRQHSYHYVALEIQPFCTNVFVNVKRVWAHRERECIRQVG